MFRGMSRLVAIRWLCVSLREPCSPKDNSEKAATARNCFGIRLAWTQLRADAGRIGREQKRGLPLLPARPSGRVVAGGGASVIGGDLADFQTRLRGIGPRHRRCTRPVGLLGALRRHPCSHRQGLRCASHPADRLSDRPKGHHRA